MRAERLELKHKDLLHNRLRSVDTPVSEYSFPNLYLFREAHGYELLDGEELFIRGRTYDGYSYLMPTRRAADIEPSVLRRFAEQVDFFFPIPEEWLGAFDPEEYSFAYKEGDRDYVYTVQKMSTYPGRRLHKKRNLLKQFMDTYRSEARPLTAELLKDARFVLSEWQEGSEMEEGLTDFKPCMEALELYDELVLCGGIYYADAEPAGFIVGEELNSGTFALHFAKARTKFKGIYQYMYNNFAQILPPNYTHLNFEQDLDSEPLKLAKASYIPDLMLKKWRVGLKGK